MKCSIFGLMLFFTLGIATSLNGQVSTVDLTGIRGKSLLELRQQEIPSAIRIVPASLISNSPIQTPPTLQQVCTPGLAWQNARLQSRLRKSASLNVKANSAHYQEEINQKLTQKEKPKLSYTCNIQII